MLDKTTISYLYPYMAGIIDGEGSIFLRQRRPRNKPLVVVTVAMTDKRIMDIAKELWGGSVSRCMGKSREGRRPMWQWTVSGADTAAVIEEILPYLIVKKAQATLALGYTQQRDELPLEIAVLSMGACRLLNAAWDEAREEARDKVKAIFDANS